jgi:hypothetical protein
MMEEMRSGVRLSGVYISIVSLLAVSQCYDMDKPKFYALTPR